MVTYILNNNNQNIDNINFFILYVVLVTVSLSFVHRDYLLWKRTIHLNKPYVFTALLM